MTYKVATTAELREALTKAKTGDVIELDETPTTVEPTEANTDPAEHDAGGQA